MSGILSSPTLPVPHLSLETSTSASELKVRITGRNRSSSLLKVETVEWVNRKGAWLIHPLLIVAGKIVIDTIPGMRQELSWTLVNLFYLGFSYLMFHWVTGIPFQSDLHSGAYDDLTLWEQIDEGAQYTPAKKWLFSVPIVLFLASTHYTHYNPWLFAINLTALVLVLIPKLPQLHRQRFYFLAEDDPSGLGTPVTPSFPRSGSSTPTSLSLSTPTIQITEEQFQ
ncbi:Orm1 type endoplasmic reticulum protein [Abortiporus biennis]